MGEVSVMLPESPIDHDGLGLSMKEYGSIRVMNISEVPDVDNSINAETMNSSSAEFEAVVGK